MALTVEELQIVLSCDATTAQAVLEKMDATVKAYTQKFQSYFDNTNKGKTTKVSGLDAVAKNVEKQTKKLAKAGSDWKKQYEQTFGETFESSMMKAKIRSSAEHGTGEYIPSGKKYVGGDENGRGGGMGDPNLYSKSIVEYRRQIEGVAQAAKEASTSTGRMLAPTFGETFKATLASLPDLINSFVMRSTDALSKVGSVIGKTFAVGAKVAIGAVRMIGTVAETTARAIGRAFKGAVSLIRGIVGAARRVGSSIKKAFNHTLLGKFVNRLKAVSLRMAAMGLIRGTIEGAKKGLEELAKTSASSAKAMNTVKAAGGSIKMALGVAVMPIVKALAPLFVRLAGAISAAGNAIARFFAVVTGQSQYTAVNFSSDLDGISESAGGAGSAVKGMLADFDELNVLQKNSGGGGGGSSGVEQSLSTVADLDAVSSLGDKVREAIESGNWTGVGEALNSKLNGISEKIKKWGTDLKNSDLGENIAEFFNGLFGDEGTFYNLGDSVGTVLDGIITQVGEFIENFNWEDAGEAIKAFFQGISDALDRNEFVLKLKIKINEIKEQFQQFKVDLLVWANGLPDWVKDFLGWFGADIPGALDEAATALANTQIKGAELQTKLNELNNTDVDVEVDAEVGDPVTTGELVKGPGWRPQGHGKTGNPSAEAEIIPGVDKPLDTPDLVGKNTGVYSTGNGLAITLGVVPSIGDRSLITAEYDKLKKAIDDRNNQDPITVRVGTEGTIHARENIEKVKTAANSIRKTFTSKFETEGTMHVRDNIGGVEKAAKSVKKTFTSKFETEGTIHTRDNIGKVKKSADGVAKTFTAKISTSGVDTAKKAVKGFSDDLSGLSDVSVSVTATLSGADKLRKALQETVSGFKVGVTYKDPQGSEKSGGKLLFDSTMMASGGIAYGLTSAIIGEYAGAKSNPEVVAPLNTLQGILERSNVGGKDTMTREQANTMIGLLKELTKKETVVRPSVELGQVVDRSLKAYART